MARVSYTSKIQHHFLNSTHMPVADIFSSVRKGLMQKNPDAPIPATEYGPLDPSGFIDVHIQRMLEKNSYEKDGRRYFEFQIKGCDHGITIATDDISIDESCTKTVHPQGDVPIVWIRRDKENELRDYLYAVLGVVPSQEIINKEKSEKNKAFLASLEVLRNEFHSGTDHLYKPRPLKILLKQCGRTGGAIETIHKRFLDGVMAAVLKGEPMVKYDGVNYARSDFKIEDANLRQQSGKLWVKGEAGKSLAINLAPNMPLVYHIVSGGRYGSKGR